MAMIRSHLGEPVDLADARRVGAYLALNISGDIAAARTVIGEAHAAGRLDQLLRGFTGAVFDICGEALHSEGALAYARDVAAHATLAAENNPPTEENE